MVRQWATTFPRAYRPFTRVFTRASLCHLNYRALLFLRKISTIDTMQVQLTNINSCKLAGRRALRARAASALRASAAGPLVLPPSAAKGTSWQGLWGLTAPRMVKDWFGPSGRTDDMLG